MKIIQNEAECKKCGDIIWSSHQHDYKTCSCGAIAVDGGMSHVGRSGNPEDAIERSMHMTTSHLSDVVRAVKNMRETGRNDLGIALGVIRSLRDNELLDMSQFINKMDK